MTGSFSLAFFLLSGDSDGDTRKTWSEFGLRLRSDGKCLVPAGINLIDGKRTDEDMEEEIFILDNERVAVNVNTLEDLRVAGLMLQPRSR